MPDQKEMPEYLTCLIGGEEEADKFFATSICRVSKLT